MSNAFIGEIRIFSGNYEPKNWAFCNGQILSIRDHPPLFSLIGTTYGGDGRTTFALPDLRGAVPMHWGNGTGLTPRSIGEKGGSTSVTLTVPQLPMHAHYLSASQSPAAASTPKGAVPADAPIYASKPTTPMAATAVAPTGNSQPHNNMQPYLAVNFIIALEGIFPSRG